MNKPCVKTLVVCAGLLVVVGVVAVQVGEHFGEKDGRNAVDRIAVLWPSLSVLTEEERIVLYEASKACHVERLPSGAAPSVVAACLRSGAQEYDARHGDKRQPIGQRLEKLLVDTEN